LRAGPGDRALYLAARWRILVLKKQTWILLQGE